MAVFGVGVEGSMWIRVLRLVLVTAALSLAEKCQKNKFLNELTLVQPVRRSLVPNPYYTKLSAEIIVDAADFREIQHEFYLCARSVVEVEEGVKEVFSECGRSVFGQGAILGAPGVNHLYISLFHNDTMLCAVNTTVTCCLDAETSAAVAARKTEAAFKEFINLGSEMTERVKPMGVIDDKSRSPWSRAQHIKSLRSDYVQKPHFNVLVGIKSSALNLVKRNNIRATWLRETEIVDVDEFCFLPFFLVGDSRAALNDTVHEILRVEYSFYEDVLLSELAVEDSYFTLGEKVLSFAKWSSQELHSSMWDINYVVICDDDVFVDIWQLKEHILQLGSAKSYYGGEVLEVRMHDTYKPIRDPQHRNHLPVKNYPLSVLPPFALGNFYLLSGDLWQYLGRNADVLKPVGTLEDLSVGIWMIGLQVFPIHLTGVCDITRCLYDNDLYLDFSTLFRQNLENPVNKLKLPVQRLLAVADLQRRTDFDLLYRLTSYRREKGWGNNQAALDLSKEVIVHLWKETTSQVEGSEFINATLRADSDGSASFDKRMERSGTETQDEELGNRGGGHNNIVVAKPAGNMAPINIVLGDRGLYALELVERIVESALPGVSLRWFSVDTTAILRKNCVNMEDKCFEGIVNEINRQREVVGNSWLTTLRSGHTILAVTVLDFAEQFPRAMRPSEQLQWTTHSQHRLNCTSALISPTSTILISGEPLDLSTLQPDSVDLLITTTTMNSWLPSQVTHIYLPVFSSAFLEMKHTIDHNYSPHDLLLKQYKHLPLYEQQRTGAFGGCYAYDKDRCVAYLYHRCDRPSREEFFDILKAKLPEQDLVVPLGRCAGSSRNNEGVSHSRVLNSRFSPDYIIEAIDAYRPFMFVIAFENSRISGYITEKLLTAFLAGAVPIYLGAPEASRMFNPDSFIDCGSFQNLVACAEKVREVLFDANLYAQMRAASPIANATAWANLFPWESPVNPSYFQALRSGLKKLID